MNEDALERERRNCETLRRRLSDVEAQAAQGTVLEPALADAKNKLKQAEAEVARLQNALNKLKQQLQVHIFNYTKFLLNGLCHVDAFSLVF